MNKNLILENVENSFVFLYKDTQFNTRLCCIANRTFLDEPKVDKVVSFAMISKHDPNHPKKPCYGSWEIDYAGADRGTGMELLIEFMSMQDVEYVMCDRQSLSDDAKIAWQRIVNGMKSNTVKLDNFMNPQTPEEEDDCMTYELKFGLDNPFDYVIKVPPITGQLQHVDINEYFADDPKKRGLADGQMRKKFNQAFAAMIKRDM